MRYPKIWILLMSAFISTFALVSHSESDVAGGFWGNGAPFYEVPRYMERSPASRGRPARAYKGSGRRKAVRTPPIRSVASDEEYNTDNESPDNDGTESGNQRLSALIQEEADKCRVPARFRQKQLGTRPICGRARSKGLCASAVNTALERAGLGIGRGDAAVQRAKLMRNSKFKKVSYNPKKAAPGTILACLTSRHSFGHIEIVVKTSSGNMFCSDFCSYNPTCSKGSFHSAVAFVPKGGSL